MIDKYITQGYATGESEENDAALEELVCDSLYRVYINEGFIRDLANSDKKLAKIIGDLRESIKLWSTRHDAPREIYKLTEQVDKMDEIRKLFHEAVAEAGKTFKEGKTGEGGEIKNSNKLEFEDYDKPITLADIQKIRSIGRKSVNEFTDADIKATQKWAYKFYQQMGTKSPFFRAWFGDWRGYETETKIDYVAVSDERITPSDVSRIGAINNDTGWRIKVNSDGIDETANKRGKWSVDYHSLISINNMLEAAVLLDTVVVDNPSKKMGNNAVFVHHFYCPISVKGEKGVAKLYIVEEIGDTKKFYLNKIEMAPTDSTDSAKALSLNSSVGTINNVSDLFKFVKENNDKFEADSKMPTKFTPKPVDPHFLNPDGTPKVFYHGTPNGTFTEFRDWQYFTDNKAYAGNYVNQGASSNGYKKTANNPKVYETYLTAKKVFDTRDPAARNIFNNEFFGKWGNGSPLSDRGLPDWTDGDDLIEFFEENGYDFDAVVLDEGGTGGYGDKVVDRGLSYVIKDSSQIKSATDNIGTFSGSKNINFSAKDTEYMATAESGDMETAQRMVDEAAKAAGYEKLVYHGTLNKSFTVFDINKAADGSLGKGFYFSGSKEYAKGYTVSNGTFSGRVIEAYINIKNPYIAKYPGGIDTEKLKAQGYDGVYSPSNDFYIVFDPSQIKSAEPITYDNNGNIIPLSERFNEEKEDIRWSQKLDKSSKIDYDNLTDTEIKELFSYDSLVNQGTITAATINKSDFGRLPVNSNGTLDATAFVTRVKNQLASVEGRTFAYVPAIGTNTRVERKGILHGLVSAMKNGSSKNQKINSFITAQAEYAINDVLENSIEVNMLDPRSNDEKYSHVLIGLLDVVEESGKKTTIVVRSIITEYKTYEPVLTQYEILGKLYAVKAKEMTDLLTGRSAPKGVALASRKSATAYNISDVIEKVKDIFPDTFSEDVYNHFGTSRKVGNLVGLKASSKLDPVAAENRRLTRENEKLQAANDMLRQQFKLTKGHHISDKALNMMANRLGKRTDSTMNKSELTERLRAIFDYIGNSDELLWEQVDDATTQLASELIKSSSSIDRGWEEEAQPVRDAIKGSRVYISPELKAEIEGTTGSYERWRRSLMGNVTTTTTDVNARSLDSWWQEKAEQFTTIRNIIPLNQSFRDEIINTYGEGTSTNENDIRFSTKDTANEVDRYYDDVIRENRALQMIFSNLDGSINTMRKDYSLDKKEVDRLARDILRQNKSKDENFGKALTTIFDYLLQMEKGKNVRGGKLSVRILHDKEQFPCLMSQRFSIRKNHPHRSTKHCPVRVKFFILPLHFPFRQPTLRP